MDEFNPYTAPDAGVFPSALVGDEEEGRGVWRDGKTLVMSKHARLPSRCLQCNEPATMRLIRKLSWHHPSYYFLWLLFPLGLIIYLVLLVINRRSATIEIPLCERHRAGRSKALLLFGLVSFAGLAALCLSVASIMIAPAVRILDDEVAVVLLIICGTTSLLFGLVSAVSSAQVVSARKIDKTHLWLRKINTVYLAALPALPYSDA